MYHTAFSNTYNTLCLQGLENGIGKGQRGFCRGQEFDDDGWELTIGQVIVSTSPDSWGLIGTSNFGATLVRDIFCYYDYEEDLVQRSMQLGWCHNSCWST